MLSAVPNLENIVLKKSIQMRNKTKSISELKKARNQRSKKEYYNAMINIINKMTSFYWQNR